jgi:AcrR family transcriptional regulator
VGVVASAARTEDRLPVPARPLLVRQLSRSRAAEIQRERLLAATVRILEEEGHAQLTVARLTSRAGVARSAFYNLFGSAEDCLIGVLERVTQAIGQEFAAHGPATLGWRDRVYAGLASVLAFVDREPAIARVWLIHCEQAERGARDYREQTLARLAALLDEGRNENSRELLWSPATAEAAIGALMQILTSRLRAQTPEPTLPLLGQLAGMVVLPYLGAQAAKEEEHRSTPDSPENTEPLLCAVGQPGSSPLAGVRMRLTHRTAQALQAAAAHPGASNRELARHLEISEPQISRLLARLERLGLTINLTDGTGKGPRNAWYLTNLGERLLGTRLPNHEPPTQPTPPNSTPPRKPALPHLSPAEKIAWHQLENAERALQETRQTLTRLTNPTNHLT